MYFPPFQFTNPLSSTQGPQDKNNWHTGVSNTCLLNSLTSSQIPCPSPYFRYSYPRSKPRLQHYQYLQSCHSFKFKYSILLSFQHCFSGISTPSTVLWCPTGPTYPFIVHPNHVLSFLPIQLPFHLQSPCPFLPSWNLFG